MTILYFKMMRRILYLVVFCLVEFPAFTQEINDPDYTYKSHQTLEILKINLSPSSTTVVMRITSQVPDGRFCIDKRTTMTLPGGKALRLEKTVNLPDCPQQHIFINPENL